MEPSTLRCLRAGVAGSRGSRPSSSARPEGVRFSRLRCRSHRPRLQPVHSRLPTADYVTFPAAHLFLWAHTRRIPCDTPQSGRHPCWLCCCYPVATRPLHPPSLPLQPRTQSHRRRSLSWRRRPTASRSISPKSSSSSTPPTTTLASSSFWMPRDGGG